MKTVLAAFDRPIAFHRIFVDVGGSVNAALLLSQAVYWQQRCKQDDGFWYKTEAEWSAETGLSRKEQATARSALERVGVLSCVRKGVPAIMHYHVNEDALLEIVNRISCAESHIQLSEKEQLVAPKPDNLSSPKGTTLYITETTTETTTDILSSDHVAAVAATSAPAKPKLNPQTLVGLYHEHCPELPTIAKLTPKREAALRARWLDASRLPNRYRCGDIAAGLEWWQAFFEVVGESDFLNGRQKNSSWRADFDWLLKPTNFMKIIEGNYNNRANHER